MSKRDYKRKIQEEEEAAALVFQEFMETFQSPSTSVANKTFVKSAVLYPDNKERCVENAGQIYNPKPLIKTVEPEIDRAIECTKIFKNVTGKNKKQDKTKSNMEILKEELKLRHSERIERARINDESNKYLICEQPENDNQVTTNLFVSYLNGKITENRLLQEFGAYGPLASVKIFWPKDDNKYNANCGFVAFMSRKDAERALQENQNRADIRVCWGKSVEIPPYPIFIPNSLLKFYLPPPLSGLPFNAQPMENRVKPISDMNNEELDKVLFNSCVKVNIPLNRRVLKLINRMVEYVIKEGPEFEAMIMNKEINNPEYDFLFNNRSPAHVYYRWRVFSILHGDSPTCWKMQNFRMFKGGSIWCPPKVPCYINGMPEELIKKEMSDHQFNIIIKLIQNLSPERSKIAEAMVFCIKHIEVIDDSIDVILQSLKNSGTSALKRISRLYLLSDVLSNCKMKNVIPKITSQEEHLLEVFKFLENFKNDIKCVDYRKQFCSRVNGVIQHWDKANFFSKAFIENVNSVFSNNFSDEEDDSSTEEPMDSSTLIKRALLSVKPNITEENSKIEKEKPQEIDIRRYVVPSKWDEVDPEEVQTQAMSTEKMHLLDMERSLRDSVKTKTSGIKKRKYL